MAQTASPNPALLRFLYSVTSLDDPALIALLMQLHREGDIRGVRAGLGHALDVEEHDLRGVVLLDFHVQCLEFCLRQCFSAVKASHLLRLAEDTRLVLGQKRSLEQVKSYFKRRLVELCQARKALARENTYVEVEELVPVPVEEEPTGRTSRGGSRSSPPRRTPDDKTKRRGKGQDLPPTPTFRKVIVRKAVPIEHEVLLPAVFDYDSAVAIVDHFTSTLFRHYNLFSLVFGTTQTIHHTERVLFLHNAFPPAPLATSMTASQHVHWNHRRAMEDEESEARLRVAAEEIADLEKVKLTSEEDLNAIHQCQRERDQRDREQALTQAEMVHSVSSVNYAINKGQEQEEQALYARLANIEEQLLAKQAQDAAENATQKVNRRVGFAK
eukprot:TRINITY_DN1587_c0_g1_i1.p1 TRINITY_DN1587_c0_g1~~TRINITY_DN1587_c0_g1_i1.p1  ORF type:complete len:384 (-),score=73.09 TRINITY_DN1587_c0_g1_i1:8-1159(-)